VFSDKLLSSTDSDRLFYSADPQKAERRCLIDVYNFMELVVSIMSMQTIDVHDLEVDTFHRDTEFRCREDVMGVLPHKNGGLRSYSLTQICTAARTIACARRPTEYE